MFKNIAGIYASASHQLRPETMDYNSLRCQGLEAEEENNPHSLSDPKTDFTTQSSVTKCSLCKDKRSEWLKRKKENEFLVPLYPQPAESRDENSPPSASMAHTSAQNTVGTVLFHSEISAVQGLLSLSSCLLQSSKPHVCPSGDQTCTAEGRTLDVGTGLEPMMTRKFEIEVGSAAAETPVTKVPEHNQGQAKSSAAYSLEPVPSDVNRGTAAEECDPSITCKDTDVELLGTACDDDVCSIPSVEVPSPLDLSACSTSQEVTSKEMDVELLGTACDDDVRSIPSVEVPSPLDLSACSTSQRCDISVSCSETTLSSTEKEQLLERIKWLERAHRRDQKKIRALEEQKEIFHEHLSDMFNSDQLSAISRHSNRGSKWSESTIKKALQLHFSCGSSGYDDILEQKLPYPSARTLRRRVEGIKFQPGVLHEVFELLQAKVPALGPQERCCLLMIDEMAIQQKLEYDPSTSSIRGYSTLPVPGKQEKTLATHGLVFMLCGISTRWKQVVGYHYTGDSFSGVDAGNKTVDIIKKCHAIELNVLAITTDMGPGNRSMWQLFKGNKEIRVLADVPHIAKNMCGHLVNNQRIVLHPDDVHENNLQGCIISLDPLKKLVDFQDGSVFKLAPNLRKEVIEPNHFDKMKVSNAMKIFSHATAVALCYMVDKHGWPQQVLTTAWFIEQVNHWFDLMCSRHPVMALSNHNIDKHREAVAFLEKFMKFFSRAKIGNGHFKPSTKAPP
ncbi:uncharacterized protein LOC135384699 [Ornithodoros turicata]|uniref:uncharacterized protein LOC135384699 n=1 Tax=Ornithodoros turicata TaxID=34597 RepID=UPI0031395DAD